ncbi:MAG: GspE/PulE family protein [Patescibacteria group bacterium]
MPLNNQTIKDILVRQNYITAEDAEAAERHAAEQGGSIDSYLLSNNIISKQLLGQAIAEHFGVKYQNLEKQKVDDDIFFKVPEIVARNQHVAAIEHKGDVIKVVTSDPENINTQYALEKVFGVPVDVHYTGDDDLEELLRKYQTDIRSEIEKLDAAWENGDDDIRDETIIDIVKLIFNTAITNKASDIHLEPERETVQVRFRIDGILHDVVELRSDIYASVLSRIKILGKLRTDEHRAAQDGKYRFSDDSDEFYDIRISVVPTKNTENVVMRVLSAHNRQLGLRDVGFSEGDLKKVEKAIKNPHGMILVTGPTGSGKTTTVYAMMNKLNRREVHVATIEDPIEYDIHGVTQIQVNERTNLTFSEGLRAIVRQDPDIIMVGEIRDQETAGIAVNSALTGHLVLSTLHTNDAPTTLPRLRDMGVEPFLIASTVEIIIAQRLVRKICSNCVSSYTLTDAERNTLKDNEAFLQVLEKQKVTLDDLHLYKGSGCSVCGDTGYAGRAGIFETLHMDDEIRKAVMQHAHADDIRELAIKNGMNTMFEDGVQKALSGVTTLEEVMRVTIA